MGNSATRTTLHKLLDDLRDEQARTDIMRRALLVYAIALDAHERGDRLAVVGMDDTIVHEIVGQLVPDGREAGAAEGAR